MKEDVLSFAIVVKKRNERAAEKFRDTFDDISRFALFLFFFFHEKKARYKLRSNELCKSNKNGVVYPATRIDQSATDPIHNLFDDWSIEVPERNLAPMCYSTSVDKRRS